MYQQQLFLSIQKLDIICTTDLFKLSSCLCKCFKIPPVWPWAAKIVERVEPSAYGDRRANSITIAQTDLGFRIAQYGHIFLLILLHIGIVLRCKLQADNMHQWTLGVTQLHDFDKVCPFFKQHECLWFISTWAELLPVTSRVGQCAHPVPNILEYLLELFFFRVKLF